jgi:hypothetical protein
MKDPKNLQTFFEFFEKDGPGMIELQDHLDSAVVKEPEMDFNNWFGTEGENYSKTLKEFIEDPAGGFYVFWYYKENLDPDEVPVCHLGGEGTAKVVAGNFDEFMQIYAGGWKTEIFSDEDEFYKEEDNIDDPEEKEKFKTGLSHFVKWIKEKCDLEPAPDPIKIVKRAKERIPNFKKWVDEKIAY